MYTCVLWIVRRVVRRATPATLPGVSGRPARAIASDDTEPPVAKEIGSIWTKVANATAIIIQLRSVNFVVIVSSIVSVVDLSLPCLIHCQT